MRVNLGCGDFPLEGWVNVDAYNSAADVQADMREVEFEGVEEVLMEHSLEHLPWADALPLLNRIYGWLAPGGVLRIEVPDMAEIMRRGASDPFWVPYIYGAQKPHEGEFHRSGFTDSALDYLLREAGFSEVGTRTFLSEHPWRTGMPCLAAVAVK